MRATKLVLILMLTGLLAACGFKLRGSAELPGYKLPFATIALGLDQTSEFHAHLKRTIEASSPGTRVVADAKDAEAVLSVIADRSEKLILSLNAAGRAREYQLVRTFSFRVHGQAPATTTPQPKYSDALATGPIEYIPPSTIALRRDITFSDDLVLSKESEEILLWRDIQGDLVQQLMRRLAAAKLQPVKLSD
jgi:LPS-assembly lipoprotein